MKKIIYFLVFLTLISFVSAQIAVEPKISKPHLADKIIGDRTINNTICRPNTPEQLKPYLCKDKEKNITITEPYWVYDDNEKHIEFPNNVRCNWYAEKDYRECYLPVHVEYKTDAKSASLNFDTSFEDKLVKNIELKTASDLSVLSSQSISKGTYDYKIKMEYPPNKEEKFNVSILGVEFDPDISVCSTLASPGTYTLTANITNRETECFNISSNNVIFDGNGHSIIGDEDVSWDYCAFVIEDYNDSIIKNFEVGGFYSGFCIGFNHNITIHNNTMLHQGTSYFIQSQNSQNINISNNYADGRNIEEFSPLGINRVNDSVVMNNTFLTGTYDSGMYGVITYRNIIKNNILAGYYGLYFISYPDEIEGNNTIYNNFINSTSKIYMDYSNINYSFYNTTNRTGDKIYGGGPNIGGNYYTAYGNTCMGGPVTYCANITGFCDYIEYPVEEGCCEEFGCTLDVDKCIGTTELSCDYADEYSCYIFEECYLDIFTTGYSDDCTDINGDGFCDNPIDFTTQEPCTVGVDCTIGYTDFLPISANYSTCYPNYGYPHTVQDICTYTSPLDFGNNDIYLITGAKMLIQTKISNPKSTIISGGSSLIISGGNSYGI